MFEGSEYVRMLRTQSFPRHRVLVFLGAAFHLPRLPLRLEINLADPKLHFQGLGTRMHHGTSCNSFFETGGEGKKIEVDLWPCCDTLELRIVVVS
jgi:hypothetical protein